MATARQPNRWGIVPILLFGAFATLGCGDDIGPTVPVSGTVTIDGAPVWAKVPDGVEARGTVYYEPDASRGNMSRQRPAGVIDPDGTYFLFTAGKEGAPPGWYKVAVSVVAETDPKDPYAPAKYFSDVKYQSVKTSGLAVEVTANAAAGAYDLKLSK